MTKNTIKRQVRNIGIELEWLARCEGDYNPDWRFKPTLYSKRRARLVKTYWALKKSIM